MNTAQARIRLPLFLHVTGQDTDSRNKLADLLIARLCEVYRIFYLRDVGSENEPEEWKAPPRKNFVISTIKGGDYSDFEFSEVDGEAVETFLFRAREKEAEKAIMHILEMIRFDSIVICSTSAPLSLIKPGMTVNCTASVQSSEEEDKSVVHVLPGQLHPVERRICIDFRGWHLTDES